ncbi:hypothetical protein GCM10029964_007740 [Kibdelosporangium lantanae]
MTKEMLLAAIASVLVGGSVPLTGMLDGYPVLTGQAIRYAIAAVVLLLWLRGRLPRPSWRDVPGLVGMIGAGMLGFNALILLAQHYATPALSPPSSAGARWSWRSWCPRYAANARIRVRSWARCWCSAGSRCSAAAVRGTDRGWCWRCSCWPAR